MKLIIAVIVTWSMMVSPRDAQVVKQSDVGKNSCGPCAIVNSFEASGNKRLLKGLKGKTSIAKAQSFIDSFGGMDSGVYGKLKTAFAEVHGSTDTDLQMMLNAYLKKQRHPPMEGCYLLREQDQGVEDFVTNAQKLIKRSMDAGFHPLLSIRAVAAEYDDEKKKNVWNSKGGHWIAIHDVSDVSRDGLGFMLHFSDSISGKRLCGYVHLDKGRKARVPMTFTVDEQGKEQWSWVDSDRCLVIAAPGMPLGTVRAKWYQRTYIALRYLVYEKSSK